ncbi:hypothetical protein BASA81_002370 [Batrachochytrium salamandrivorans]|nr:hypothetical protein BASA81_002370 [Batrachochytrium salamandrivorans]
MGCSSSVPAPHTCHLAVHPQYPARAPVKRLFWSEADAAYAPVRFTHAVVLEHDRTKHSTRENGWADPAQWTPELEREVASRPCLSTANGRVPMHSHRPRNPKGRTGMVERGLLGKYGPNIAADIVFLRTNSSTGRLQIILIKRSDNGLWSLPGGMLDEAESAFDCAKREFWEEALASQTLAPELQAKLDLCLNQHKNGREVYRGYVDDPRNTDWAWMETTAFLFYAEDEALGELPVRGGDDAAEAKWVDFSNQDETFKHVNPAHREILSLVMKTEYFQNMKAW